MKHSFFGALKKGLFALAPLVITIALLRWVYHTLEAFFDPLIAFFIGNKFYFPGMGVVLAIVLIVVVGYLLDYLLIQKLYNYGEKILTKIPLVKTLYGSLRQFMSFFKSDEKKLGQAVRVKIGDQHMMGILTQSQLLHMHLGSADEVAVFLPMSYQMGGYTVIVSKKNVEMLSMSVEEVLKFAVTAGVLNHSKESE